MQFREIAQGCSAAWGGYTGAQRCKCMCEGAMQVGLRWMLAGA